MKKPSKKLITLIPAVNKSTKQLLAEMITQLEAKGVKVKESEDS